MKTYKVIFKCDTKGKETETVIVNADIFGLVRSKGFRCYTFFDNDGNLKAIFKAKKVVAIYEV